MARDAAAEGRARLQQHWQEDGAMQVGHLLQSAAREESLRGIPGVPTDHAFCWLAAMLLSVVAVPGCSTGRRMARCWSAMLRVLPGCLAAGGLPVMERCGQMQLLPGLAPRSPWQLPDGLATFHRRAAVSQLFHNAFRHPSGALDLSHTPFMLLESGTGLTSLAAWAQHPHI